MRNGAGPPPVVVPVTKAGATHGGERAERRAPRQEQQQVQQPCARAPPTEHTEKREGATRVARDRRKALRIGKEERQLLGRTRVTVTGASSSSEGERRGEGRGEKTSESRGLGGRRSYGYC